MVVTLHGDLQGYNDVTGGDWRRRRKAAVDPPQGRNLYFLPTLSRKTPASKHYLAESPLFLRCCDPEFHIEIGDSYRGTQRWHALTKQENVAIMLDTSCNEWSCENGCHEEVKSSRGDRDAEGADW
jgi:hypothetical protein